MNLSPIQDTDSQPPDNLGEFEKEWIQRESRLMNELSSTLQYYTNVNKIAAKYQRAISLSVMIGGVIAPVLVAASANNQTVFGLSSPIVSGIVVVLTSLIAIVEGTKRIYRFEQRWVSCNAAKRAIKNARENYRAKRIGLKVGSPEWQQNYFALRAAFEAASDKEAEVFFESIKTSTDNKSDATRN